MKTIQLSFLVLSITLLTACGGSTQNSDDHNHTDDCTHSHNSSSDTHMHKQESFTVEADSTNLHHAEEAETTHEHNHADGTTHKH
jgi:outer membrane biogenesis lipoprotein LolB